MTNLNNYTDIKDVEQIYLNGNLAEYLKGLDYKQLCDLKTRIICDDVLGIRLDVMNLLEDEIECRVLEKFISLKDAEFISDGFNLRINDENYSEIKESFILLSSLGDFQNAVKWCPSLLFLNKTYKVYFYLKDSGRTDEEIIEFLCSSFDKTMKLSDAINKEQVNEKYRNEFNQLISKVAMRVSLKKSGTESYDKYVDKMFQENEDLLKRLS